jgi:2-polyprenyl-3-methyl-5-hydroxy-6-metoxy-1,4-benzoquinol methylase
MTTAKNDRWEREAAFFDQKAQAERASGLKIPDATVRRYANASRAEFPAEYRFMGLGNLDGLRILDIGCGDGRATVLLALLGAQVTGIDISPDAIEVAKERATINGVAERCAFICSPLEIADIAPGTFDVIWCDAFLHHVIPDLPSILTTMKSWLVTGGRIVITEPVSLSAGFRHLRLALLPAPDATPDERPLEHAELEIVRMHFPQSTTRFFGLLSRGAHPVLPGGNFERAAAWRKIVYRVAAHLDQALFSIGLRNLSSQIIFHGRK